MDASEIDTIEDILRQYDVDGLLDHVQFTDLVETLRNRENIMISSFIPFAGDKETK
jgi:hypothetical protein